jgi:hypothetical protein
VPKSWVRNGGTAGGAGAAGGGAARFGHGLGGLGDVLEGVPGRLEFACRGLETGGQLAHPRAERVHEREAADGKPADEPQDHEGRPRHGGNAQPLQAADQGPEQGVQQQG